MNRLMALSLTLVSYVANAQTIAIPSQPQIIYVQYASSSCPNNLCQLVYFKYIDDYDPSYGNYTVFAPGTSLNSIPDNFTYDKTSSGYPNNFYANSNNTNVALHFVGYAGKVYVPFNGQQMINYEVTPSKL